MLVRRSARADIEAYGSSLLGRRRLQIDDLTTQHIALAYAAEDPWITGVLSTVSRYLGATLASIHLSLGIERFFVVGGFAVALGSRFCDAIAQNAQAHCWNLGQHWHTMVTLAADDLLALRGAGVAADFEVKSR